MSKTNVTKQKWIEKGYEHFALYGPDNVSINMMSKELGLSRASFYHHFGDMEVFIEELLGYHWHVGVEFITIGKKRCKKLFPDLYELISEYPLGLLFTRQLFLNRNNLAFNYMFIKMYKNHAKQFVLELFSEQYGFHHSNESTLNLWLTLGESWYSRLDPSDLSAKNMQQLAEEIMSSVLKFISTDLFSKIKE